MATHKKTAEEIAQEAEATARKAEEEAASGGGHTLLTPNLIQNNPPNPADDFASIMLTYHVPQGDTEAIIKYLNDTGSDNIYSNIPELISKLMKFPRQVPPYARRQIMDHWIALNKITTPEDYDKIVETTPEEYRKVTGKEKYTVDPNNEITVASSNEPALTYDEAAKLAASRKAGAKPGDNKNISRYVYDTTDKAIRLAKETEPGGTMEEAKELKKMADESNKKPSESPFMQTEDGQWAITPGAKLNNIELMTWQGMQKAAASGVPVDPVQEMINSADKWKTMKELFGGGTGIPAYLASPEAFAVAVKAAVGGDNAAVTALSAKIDQMIADQHAVELKRRDDMIDTLTKTIEGYKNEVTATKEELLKNQHTTGAGAIDVIRDGFSKLPDKSDIRGIVHDIISNPPRFAQGTPADASKRLADIANKSEEAATMKKAADAIFSRT